MTIGDKVKVRIGYNEYVGTYTGMGDTQWDLSKPKQPKKTDTYAVKFDAPYPPLVSEGGYYQVADNNMYDGTFFPHQVTAI